MALPPLSVKIGAETDGLTKGLTGAQASIAKFAKVGVAAAGAVGVAMVALTKQSLAQVDAQAKLAQSMGTTVKSMQTLEQAGKLAGVAMSGVQQATGDLTRRLAQAASGAGPVADALDRLGLSAVALSNIPLDERVLKINEALNAMVPAAERAAVAGQLFGEEGSLAMARIDTATIRQAQVDIERFGVAVSEVAAQNIEDANDAVTRLGLVMTGLGNRLATQAAPAIEATANALIALADAFIGANVSIDDFLLNQNRARAILGEDVFNALNGNVRLVRENEAALQELATVLGILQGPLSSTANVLSAFADELRRVGDTKAEAEIMALVDNMEALDWQLANGGLSLEEYNSAMNGVVNRAEELITSLQDVSKVGYLQAITNLGDLRTAIQLAIGDAARLIRTLPGGTPGVTTGTGLTPEGMLIPPPRYTASGRGTVNPTATDALLAGMGGEFITGDGAGGGAGGGAGAGTDPNEALREQLATRLETLMEGLMTERETVANWYAEGQALLEEARANELLTEQQYADQKERLAKEHQDRLSRIRELGAAADLHTVLGAGAEILNAMGQTNEKALKVAKVFGAAQALISAYQGAAEALKLPFPQNIAAAATVLAKGIGFVSAIKGVNKSGGAVASTGGATAAASAPQAQAAPQATQTLNFSVTSDPFGISDRLVRQIVGAINQSQRDGSTLIRATVS
jgi:hypothetical protein